MFRDVLQKIFRHHKVLEPGMENKCMTPAPWLNIEQRVPVRTPSSLFPQQRPMVSSLLNQIKKMGNRGASLEEFMEVPMDVAPPTHHTKKAVRGWRILLDKMCTLLAFASLQHPKERLKGGGNASSSYIVCRDYLARWPNHFPAAEIKRQLKENKDNAKKGGFLRQAMDDAEMESAAGWETSFPAAPISYPTIGGSEPPTTAQIQELQQLLMEEQRRNHEMQEYVVRQQMRQQATASSMPMSHQRMSAVDMMADALLGNEDYDPSTQGVRMMKAASKKKSTPKKEQEVFQVDSDSGL